MCLVIGIGFDVVAMCPAIETHSYALQRRATEEPLIKAVLSDEAASLGPQAFAALVSGYGDKVTVVNITPDMSLSSGRRNMDMPPSEKRSKTLAEMLPPSPAHNQPMQWTGAAERLP